MEHNSYTLPFKVRDYECDAQGIVSHANYLNYLMHTRHEFLLEKGIDFIALAKADINLVVYRSEVDYKFPLKAADAFKVTLQMERESKLKFVFHQEIYRDGEEKPALVAKILCSCMNGKGRPIMPKELSAQLDGLCG